MWYTANRRSRSMAKSTLDKSLTLAFVFLFFVLLHDSLCVITSSKSNKEAEALLKWKASLQIKNQFSLASWTFPSNNATSLAPCSTWHGIYCEDGSVSRISLAFSGIVGTLNEFPFSYLSNLSYLYLSSNELHGSIPPQISQLTKLIELDLSYNQLSGNIPPEIGLLTHLEFLVLGYNRLNGSITQEIGKLNSLIELSLFSNNLEGPIPMSLKNLSDMNYLNLYKNSLRDTLHEFPFSSLCNLIRVDLSFNELHGSIPPKISQLTMLIHLDLSFNQLSGNIPPEIGLLTLLEVLVLGYNRLNGSITEEIGKLKSIKELSLNKNNLEGPIPTSLGNLSLMTHLNLSNNLLTGSAPAMLGKLESLESISLNDNRFFGFIPPEFGSTPNLEYLDLSSNSFSHSIPKEFGNSLHLKHLSLGNNQLSHEIPITLMNLTYLLRLDLSNNLLIGHIPASISDLKYLENLNLSHNRLSGGIPENFSNMPELLSIDVSYNELQGPIPHSKAIQEAGFEALRGNEKLCGDIQGLQSCSCSIDGKYSDTVSRCKRKIPFLVILIPLLGALLLVFTVTGIFIIRRKRKEDPQPEKNNAYDKRLSWISAAFDGRIMYKEIIKATNDFDASYCIGRGGFGVVYKAELPSAGIVAVKKFHSSVDGENAFQEEFLREIKTLLEIKHRNIVKLHGFCSNARHTFLVYGYLERGSLASFLRREETAKELDWIKRLNIVKGVARALYYLHHDCLPPIIHRDISSGNVLLDSKWEAHVADFGASKLLKTDSSNRSKIAGTYGYMAPELAYMMKVTEKCDVYSFGVLSLEVIKGEHPCEIIESLLSTRGEAKMIVKDVLDQRLPPPSLAVEYELKVILELAIQCMHFNREHRPTMHMICQQLLTRFGFQGPPPQLCLD